MCHSGQGTYERVEFNTQIFMGKFSVEFDNTPRYITRTPPKFNTQNFIGKIKCLVSHPPVNFPSV